MKIFLNFIGGLPKMPLKLGMYEWLCRLDISCCFVYVMYPVV